MGKKNKRLHKNAGQPAASMPGKEKIAAGSPGGWMSMTNWLVVLVMFLPLLFSTQTLDPTISTRYIFLAAFTGLFVLFFYIWRKRTTAITSLKIKIVFALGIAFGAWSIMSMVNAVNIAEAFYPVSRYFLQLILLFIIMNTVMNEEGQVLKICKVIMLLSIVQSIIGIMQYYEMGFENIPGNYTPYGLMANRNLFGSAQVLVIPFSLYTLYKASKGWKIASIVALVSIIISLLLSQTRSAWLGGLFILFGSLLLVLFFSKDNRKKWLLGSAIALVAIAAVVAMLISSDQEGTLSASIKERALSISSAAVKDSSASSAAGNINERFKFWKSTIALIKDHPVMGVGPGNWKLSIPAYGTPDMSWADGYYIPDEPHNVYLFVAAETGLPGTLLYFAGWLFMAMIALVVIRKTPSQDKKVLVILMLTGLGAFAIDSMFSFPTQRIEHSLYMLLMGGIILGSYATLPLNVKGKIWTIKKPVWITAIFIIVFNLFIGSKKYNIEEHANRTKGYEKAKMYPEMLDEAKKGISSLVALDPNGTPLEMYSGIAYKNLKNYDAALKEMKKASRLAPNNAKVYNNLGTIYTELEDYNNAIKAYLHALKLASKFEATYKNLAVNYFQVGNYTGCIEAISHIKTDNDGYFNSLLNDAKAKLAAMPEQKK
jgi:O-antigen ligase